MNKNYNYTNYYISKIATFTLFHMTVKYHMVYTQILNCCLSHLFSRTTVIYAGPQRSELSETVVAVFLEKMPAMLFSQQHLNSE